MPQRKASIKDLRQAHKRHLHNLDVKTDLKKTIKEFLTAVEAKNKKGAADTLKLIYKKVDKAAKKDVIKKNTASRRKSRFSRLLAKLA